MALTISSCSNESVTVSSTASRDTGNYRSCLKRPCNQSATQTPCKETRFAADQVKLIEPLSGHDLWDFKSVSADRVYADTQRVSIDKFAKDYVNAHGVAYAQFTACCRSNIAPSVSGVVENQLLIGIGMGHRSLENAYGEQAVRERQERACAHVRFIVNTYQQQGVRDEILGGLSKELSSEARSWARFIGRIDAVAAHGPETILRENVPQSTLGDNQVDEIKPLRYISRDAIKRAVRKSYHVHGLSQVPLTQAALRGTVEGRP